MTTLPTKPTHQSKAWLQLLERTYAPDLYISTGVESTNGLINLTVLRAVSPSTLDELLWKYEAVLAWYINVPDSAENNNMSSLHLKYFVTLQDIINSRTSRDQKIILYSEFLPNSMSSMCLSKRPISTWPWLKSQVNAIRCDIETRLLKTFPENSVCRWRQMLFPDHTIINCVENCAPLEFTMKMQQANLVTIPGLG